MVKNKYIDAFLFLTLVLFPNNVPSKFFWTRSPLWVNYIRPSENVFSSGVEHSICVIVIIMIVSKISDGATQELHLRTSLRCSACFLFLLAYTYAPLH